MSGEFLQLFQNLVFARYSYSFISVRIDSGFIFFEKGSFINDQKNEASAPYAHL